MSLDKVVIVDSEGRRALDADRLPLRVGTAADCEVRLPGPGSRAVAVLDRLDDEVFIQPVGATGAVLLNGEPLTSTASPSCRRRVEVKGSPFRRTAPVAPTG